MTDTTAVDVPAQRDEDALVERACRAYVRTWSAMACTASGGSCDVSHGLARVRTQLPVAPWNGIWGLTPQVTVSEVVAAVDEFLGGALPWNLQLRPGHPAELDAELAARGLVATAQIPFMLLTDPARAEAAVAAVPAVADRTLRPVTNFVDVDSLLTLLEQGFSMPPALTRVLIPMQMVMFPGARTWIVAAEGQDVSTALGAVEDACCGIFNVATPERHRGRGYGALATAQAVVDGFASGATSAYLQSSALGYPVYEKLGFTTAERWQQWMPEEYVS